MERPKDRMTEEQRAEATRRVLAGEKATALAVEYGVTRAYISLLKAQALDPDRFNKKRESKLLRKLTDEQLEQLRHTVTTSNPDELKLDPPILRWSFDHVIQISERLFGKRPSKRVIDECLALVKSNEPDRLLRRPQPPKKHHINQLDVDLARDPDFVKYYLSPAAERLAWREYELALADWQARYGDAEVVDLNGEVMDGDGDEIDWEVPGDRRFSHGPPAPGQRVGKHAGSKGSPFTPSKKKRRKKRR